MMAAAAARNGRGQLKDRRLRAMARLSRTAAVIAALIGVGSLIGWLLGIPNLVRPVDGMFPIQPLFGISLALAGACLVLASARRGRGIVLLVVGILALVVGLVSLDVVLGSVLVTGATSAFEWPWGAPHGPTVFGIIYNGLAALILAGLAIERRAWRRTADVAAMVGIALSLTALLEYAVGIPVGGPVLGLSSYGAAGLLMISWGALASSPDDGWFGVMFGDGLGAAVARRLAIITVPSAAALGIVVYVIAHAMTLSVHGTLVLFAVATLGGGAFLMWWTARLIDRLDARRRQAERELAARKRREEIAHEVAYAGTWECDLASERLTLSPPLRKLYGFAPGVESSWDDFMGVILPEDLPVVTDLVEHDWREGERLNAEFRIRASDGTVHWIKTTGAVVEEAGFRGVVGLSVDVTELRLTDEKLRAARRSIDDARAAHSQFVAGVSHELRQPVQSLLLYMALLRRSASGHMVPIIEGLEESVDALGRLVDAMLEISRLDAGIVPTRREPVHLGDLFDRLARAYGRRAADAGIGFRIVPTSLSADSDPVVLERILRLLIDNALRFTSRGWVLIGTRRQGDGVRLVVADTGVGIPEDKLDAVFDDFLQLENPDRDRAKGFGLGLSVARRLANLLGHRIGVVSRFGSGSMFTVEVPLARTAAPRPVRKQIREACMKSTENLLVAVIEDDAIVRNGIRATLTSWGHDVVDGATIEDVLAALAGSTPDVIVADYLLRGHATGVEAVKEIRKACRWPVPGLILTGDSDAGRFAEVERGGMPVLQKPVPPEELRKTIDAVIAETPWSR